MSSKGIKANKASSEGIVFSSFGSDPSEEERDATTKNKQTLSHKVSNLVQVETALQIHTAKSSTKMVPLPSFFDLAGKISLSGMYALGEIESKDVGDLSLQEKLLSDLLGVASPALYRLRKSDGAARRDFWSLELVPFDGNRLLELHRLSKEEISSLDEQTKANLDEAIKYCREYAAKSAKTPTKKKKRSLPSAAEVVRVDESLILPGMTVEQRVRARAQAKRKHQESQHSSSAGPKPLDNVWLVRLADALWSHASDILLRQASFQRAGGKVCTLTLQDAVSVLRQSLPGETRRKIVQGILDVKELVPEWISLSDSTTELEKLPKTTTVWLKPAEYKIHRSQLMGQEPAMKRLKSPLLLTRPTPQRSSRKKPLVDLSASKIPRVSPKEDDLFQPKRRQPAKASSQALSINSRSKRLFGGKKANNK